MQAHTRKHSRLPNRYRPSIATTDFGYEFCDCHFLRFAFSRFRRL